MMKVWVKSVLTMVVITVIMSAIPDDRVNAAENEVVYISVEAFSENVAKEIDVAAASDSYTEGLKAIGIIKESDFTSYTKNITRGDAMVILNRADEYLYGNNVDTELVQHLIDKRISDIGKVAEGKRADVAKAYLKGFMKGYDNGVYSEDRELKVTRRITKKGAISCIEMLKNKYSRAKMSPDGQLIRTTKLPKNAKTYPYILASYPNAYYEKARVFEGITEYDMDGNLIKYKSGLDYFNPIDIKKFTPSWYEGEFSGFMALKQSEWVDKAISYVEHVFNVDYRNINDQWVQDMIKYSIYFDSNYSNWYQGLLEQYVKYMKEATTKVKGIGIAADPSSIYVFEGKLYVRVRVKYQIQSTNVSPKIDTDTYIDEDPYRAVFFSTSRVDLRGYKASKWIDGYFDIRMNPSWYDNNDIAVSGMEIDIYR